jgi:hypothetical protein
MSDAREPNLSRRQLLQVAGTMAAAAASGITAAGAAEGGEMLPLKATFKGPGFPPFVIPWDPPVWGAQVTAQGDSDLLGPITYLEHSTIQLSVVGAPISVPGAIGALVGANGDVLFFRFTGLVQPTATGVTCNHAMVFLGGKGKFVGATGTGVLQGEINAVKNEASGTITGTISMPKKSA